MKRTSEAATLITLSVRVTEEMAERLRLIAEAEHRPVAAQIRRLIQQRIEADDAQQDAA